MRRPLTFLVSGLFAFALLGATSLVGATPTASAATAGTTTTCSNGVDDTPGLGLICQVTIVNTITPSGGSAKVTIRECHGAAGAPTAACTTKTTHLTHLVTHVTQCNAATNGGGGTLRCSVRVTNNFVGKGAGASKATINQCVGSGDGIANDCDPFPASTTNATITQCNGSANGGTLVRLQCTASGTKSSVHGVRINQCNGSTNGGGALVICSATIVNRTVNATTTTSRSTTGSGTPSVPNTSTAEAIVAQPTIGLSPLVLAGLTILVSLSLIAAYRRFDPSESASARNGSAPR